MINISDKAKKLYAAEIIPGTITITINGTDVDSGAWLSGSLSITEALCSKDSLDYSSVESNVLEVEFASENGNTTGLKGETVSVKQTVNGETVPLGTFTIADATLDGDYFTKLKAYDDMKKFIDSDITDWWNSTVKFPITIHDLLIALCAQVGVATDLPDTWTNATVSVNQTTYVQNFKASELLGMIQEACGLFFHTNRQNKLTVVTGTAQETSIPYTDLVEDAKVSDYTVPAITGVQIKATEKDTGGFYGEKTTVYQIVGNYLLMGKEEAELQSIAKNVLATIGGKSYKPFSAKVKARNYLEVGDPVRITTYKGMTTAAPLLSRKMSDDGLITDELVVKGTLRNGTNPLTNRKILQFYSQKIHEVEETLDGFNSTFEEIKTTQTELGKSISDAKSEWQQTANGISQTVSSNYKRTVTGQQEEFAQGDSDTTAPVNGWSTTQPTREDGKYIWRRTVTTFGDGTTSTSPGVCITGPKGDKGDTGARGLQGIQGEKGDQGVPGKDGASGKTSYFHIKYSPVAKPTSSSQLSEIPSDYIGTYVDFNEADSTDPSKYTWSQFKGSQGPKGDKGIAGANGVNGKTTYLHIAYATSSDGKTGFSVSESSGKTYIGQYTDFTESDSTDYTKYSWTLIKGDKGDKGETGATGATGPQGPTGAKGADGKGIKSTAVTYQAAPTQTVTPTGTWSGSVPSLSESSPYLWTRTVITYTDNTTSTSYSVSSAITDPRINSTIIKHEQEYYLSTSDTSLAGGSWSTTFPTRKDGTFYWVRYKDTHANNAVTYDPSANGKLLTEVNEVWNSVVSNQTAINSSNAQINMNATSVTSVKNDLGKKADTESVNSSMDKLSSTVTDIGKQIADLKVKANSIEASVTEVNNLAQTTKKATAALTANGLSVDTGQTTKSVVDGTGLTITSKADNSVVAKFTTGESEIQNLKIDGFMKIGAHVVQKMQGTEWDGTTVNGTGWMWNGG